MLCFWTAMNSKNIQAGHNPIFVNMHVCLENLIEQAKQNEFKLSVHFFAETKNDYEELDKKTWHYQKKFGFKVNPRINHEFWNVEADAFKHAFGSANMYLKYGEILNTCACIINEWQVNKNPQREWNMDSWNDNQGHKIAKEVLKEYGSKFHKMPASKRDDIVAVKVMERMRNGQLIVTPDDERRFSGFYENASRRIKLILEGRMAEKY